MVDNSRMLCMIADLVVDIPEAGGMAPRCKEYLSNEEKVADITIEPNEESRMKWSRLSDEAFTYLETGFQFYRELLSFQGMMLHASAVEMHGKAYLFSGPCGIGKSTHTRLWQQAFGADVQVFNDDKPALRYIENRWFAYGTPWCGKDGINQNKKVPLAGICFLKQGQENQMRRLGKQEALAKIISQTTRKFKVVEQLDLMLALVERLVHEIPVYELVNKPEIEAAYLSFETMCSEAQEEGL